MITVDNKFLKQTPIAEGGEGLIYEYNNDTVIKIYKDNVNKQEKHTKISSLFPALNAINQAASGFLRNKVSAGNTAQRGVGFCAYAAFA